MTLTEEQLAALKRVAAYMDEMYSVASPYHGCTEDSDLLRAMIDSGDHVRTQLAAAIAEIERLRAENAWLKSDREFQSEEQAARIKELEADLKQSERVIDQLLAMHQEGYLNSAIGRAFGISGTHVGKLIRKYQEEAGG